MRQGQYISLCSTSLLNLDDVLVGEAQVRVLLEVAAFVEAQRERRRQTQNCSLVRVTVVLRGEQTEHSHDTIAPDDYFVLPHKLYLLYLLAPIHVECGQLLQCPTHVTEMYVLISRNIVHENYVGNSMRHPH